MPISSQVPFYHFLYLPGPGPASLLDHCPWIIGPVFPVHPKIQVRLRVSTSLLHQIRAQQLVIIRYKALKVSFPAGCNLQPSALCGMQVDNTTHRILPEISFSQLTYQPLSHLPTSSLFSPGNTSLITSTLISQSFCGMPTQKLFHTWSCFKYVTIHSISSFVYTLLDSFGINRLGQVCPFSSCQGTCHGNSLLSLLVLRLLPNFRPNSFW